MQNKTLKLKIVSYLNRLANTLDYIFKNSPSKLMWDLFSITFFFYKFKRKASYEFEEAYEREKGFSKYYIDNILPLANAFNTARTQSLKKTQLRIYLLLLPTTILDCWLILTYLENKTFSSFHTIALMFVFILILGHTLEPIASYKKAVKGEIFSRILSFFGEYKCVPDFKLKGSLYEGSEILPKCPEESEDFIAGTYKNTKLIIYKTRIKGIFNGVIILTEVEKTFIYKTIIDNSIKNRHPYNKKLTHKNKFEFVNLDYPEFENNFKILSQDKMEASRLLTHTFMDSFLKLYEHFGKKRIKASFYNKQLLIAASSDKDMFEPQSILKEEDFVEISHKLLKEISLIFNIIDSLKD